jgi:hypothetical protein
MEKHNKINWLSQERIDIPDLQGSSKFKIRSYEEILNDMVASLQASSGERLNVSPGSMIHAFLTTMAYQFAMMQDLMQLRYENIRVKGDPIARSVEFYSTVQVAKPLDFIPIQLRIGDDLKCECGSEKTGSNKHSTWCDKYSPDM